MKRVPIYFVLCLLIACKQFEQNNNYKEISNQQLQKLNVLDTLVNNPRNIVLKVGDSLADPYAQLLVKTKPSENSKNYLFDEAKLENDSIAISYGPAFIYDEETNSRKNGIWVYTKFSKSGVPPFTTSSMEYSVDSIPPNWKKKVPTKEGIYFYQDNSLQLISTEQSEKQFNDMKRNGFYFFPNNGRMFERININQLP